MFWKYIFIFFFFFFFRGNSQDLYRLTGAKLLSYDFNTCTVKEEFDFADNGLEKIPNTNDTRFHPDGHIYIHTPPYLYRYHPIKKEVNQRIRLNTARGTSHIAISEEGRIILSNQVNSISEIFDYDLRQNKVIHTYDSQTIPVVTVKYVGGILKDGFFLIPTMIAKDNQGMWNPKTGQIDSFPVEMIEESRFMATSIYYPPCQDLGVSAIVVKSNGPKSPPKIGIAWGDTISNPMQYLCDFELPILPIAGANPTDFRQSPLRIHLDADQSSGHMTGGYYDTLTTCRKEVPIADKDIKLFTCGGVVDSVSFRLRYYDQPLLPAEYLTAEEGGGHFRKTSPSRWVWDNPYGGDEEEQIIDFLRSIRYHADWDPEDADQSRERVVMTTMYVDGDSTTSWTVYQLEQDEVYAGRDTAITYCPDAASLDLADYLSPGANRSGKIEPVLMAGGMIFTPGDDPDTTYLYIVEEEGCADTALFQIESFTAEEFGLDTVFLCPGESVKIGFVPGGYEVTWWDGNWEDSILVSAADAGSRQVSVGMYGCDIPVDIEIMVRESEGQAGENRMIPYCADGGAFSLTGFLPEVEDYTPRLEPALQSGELIFTPGTDPPGDYRYILLPAESGSGCPDTALITMEESDVGEIILEPVRLCDGSEVKTGLPAGTYDDIRWWNGHTGDSTLVTTDDTGDLWVEAMRDGCAYHGSFTAEVIPMPDFPDHFPDRLTLCAGEEVRIRVEELDSVRWNDRTYDAGEEIVFTKEGNIVLTGYLSGCTVEKDIQAKLISDPSPAYSKEIYFCEGESILLTLPEDTPELSFAWADGTAGPERTEQEPGEYVFEINAGKCMYASSYTLTLMNEQDCSPGTSCTVSIPNAVSPNGDGVNDRLEVFSDCDIQVTDIRIFDKWGGELYHVQGGIVEAQIWEELPPGVVMVQVDYKDARGRTRTEAQAVMVVK